MFRRGGRNARNAANYCISDLVDLYLLRVALKARGQALTPCSQKVPRVASA